MAMTMAMVTDIILFYFFFNLFMLLL